VRQLKVVNRTAGSLLGDRIALANRWWSRARGLLGRRALRRGEGLLLSPCRAIHTHGMQFALDVVFLDSRGRVVETYPDLEPGARTPYHREAEFVLELPRGILAETETRRGDVLTWLPVAVRASRLEEMSA
jgi:uncharacterized membrane protein (UPF0127 family)